MTPLPIFWSQEKCEEYRSRILERMKEKPYMTLDDDPPMRAFILREDAEPLSLYHHIGNSNHYDMRDLKQNAFEQIGLVCGYDDEPMSIGTIRRDFSPKSEWNHDIPEKTRELFSCIEENAQELVDEMVQKNLLEHIILKY